MARAKYTYWMCIEQSYGKWSTKKWVVLSGRPKSKGVETLAEFEDEEYRPFFKGLPKFEAGKVYKMIMGVSIKKDNEDEPEDKGADELRTPGEEE